VTERLDTLAEAERIGTMIREAVRDGHALLRDLKAATKEARAAVAEVERRMAVVVDDRISQVVMEGLGEYKAELAKAIASADKRVADRFDQLAAIYLGEDPKSRREGLATLAELAERRRRSGNG